MIKKQEYKGFIHKIAIAKGAPKISHLLFANDNFIFFKANPLESQVIKTILEDYAAASGQIINFEKSAISFSKNVRDEVREVVGSIVGLRREGSSGNYLGLLSLVGRNKREILGFIKNRVINRVQSWKHKFLTKAGKEVLLKNVIQAIPLHVMSVFLLPSEMVNEIERVMNAFW